MLHSQIIIFTGPIRSGKTTALRKLTGAHQDTAGILTPDDAEGRKVLYDISKKAYHEFELPADSKKPSVGIGKFSFSEEGFQKGKQIIAAPNDAKLFIVDEAGKLEILYGKGFEPALTALINLYKQKLTPGKLLLVIRDSLLQEGTQKYGLQHATIVNSIKESDM